MTRPIRMRPRTHSNIRVRTNRYDDWPFLFVSDAAEPV